jgi:hypothetical protein
VNVQLSMTLGDLVVASTTVLAIIGAYYAVKNNLLSLTSTVNGHDRTIEEHRQKLATHGEQLAALNIKVFRRRAGDRAD